MSNLADKTLAAFHRTGAYLQGHFKLTSGLHSPEYLQCALVLQHPDLAQQLGADLALELQSATRYAKIDFVAAPAMGGLIIGHEVARALGARFIFAERDAGTRQMALRRGFTVQPAEKGIVIEDVITTGGSSAEVIKLLQEKGAIVAAAGSIIDRSGGTADLKVPRVMLATLQVAAYPEMECPMCRDGLPVEKPGSRPA